MKKIEQIKEYFLKNNITDVSGAYGQRGNKEKFTFNFYTDRMDFNYRKEFIVCLKKENTSYLINFLETNPSYQKLGDFNKGLELAKEIEIYYSGVKYTNSPTEFVDPNKQKYFESGRKNIEKYYKFWENKFFEYPEYSDTIINRFELIKQRKFKLKKLQNE